MTTNKEDDGWTTIDLDELEDIEIVDEEPTGDLEEDEDDLEIVEEEDKSDKSKAVESKGKPSRSEERIRQLVSKEKEAKQKLIDAEKRIQELEQAHFDRQKQSAEAQKSLIDTQINTTQDAIERAAEDGDFKKVAELSRKLASLEVDKRITDAQASKKAPEFKETKPAADLELPEEMQAWVDLNPWALNPTTAEEKAKVRATRRIGRELAAEGYLETEPEFFDELDSRLEKSFASKGDDDVQYKEKDTKPSSSDVKKRTSPVSATARTPASRRTRIALSAEERDMADKLGLDPKQYALRKKAREDNTDTLGWTTIL